MRLDLPTPVWLGLSVVTLVVTAALAGAGVQGLLLDGLWAFALALFCWCVLIALWRGLLGLARLVKALQGQAGIPVAWTVAATLGNLAMVAFGALVAYASTLSFARGRQLRRFGRVLLPGLRGESAWTALPIDLAGAVEPPAGLADQWRQNGKTEHASVAAFARLTLDLMALGAPPQLVVAANQDALDETRHTELCFSLAFALDGRQVGPGPFPQAQCAGKLPRSRTLGLAKLAVDSLVDGALHEGLSARVIAKLAQRCEVPAIGALLREIAADEGRHAAHGFSVVEWCLKEGGSPVVLALLGALRALPREMRSQLPEPASQGLWEAWGIHSHGLETQEYEAALAHLIRRVQHLAGTPVSAAA